MEQHASIEKVATKCKNQKGRKKDDKKSFLDTYFICISNDIESKIRSVNKLTKCLSFPRSKT